MQDQLLCSIAEATTALGIGRTKVYALLTEGRLVSVQIGTRRLIKVDSITALVAESEAGAA